MPETPHDIPEFENEELSMEEIIDEYCDLRKQIQDAVDFFIANAEEFVTLYNLPNVKFILYSYGTDRIVSEVTERYKYMLNDWKDRYDDDFINKYNIQGFVFIYLLEKVFTDPDIQVYPKDSTIHDIVRSAKWLSKKVPRLHSKVEDTDEEIDIRDDAILEAKMSEDEAQEHVKKKPEVNKKIERLYKEEIDGLNELCDLPEIHNIDIELLTGKIEYFKAIREIQLIPEFQEIYTLGYELASSISSKAIRKFQKDLNQGFEVAMINTFNSIYRLRECFIDLDKVQTTRKTLIESIFEEVGTNFFKFLIEHYQKEEKCSYEKAMERIIQMFYLNYGDCYDYQLLKLFENDLTECKNVINKVGNRLEASLKSEKEIADEELEDLFDEMLDLMSTRVRPESAIEIGEFTMSCTKLNIGELWHYIRTDIITRFDLDIHNYQVAEEQHLDLQINRHTGEITVSYGHIPFADYLSEKAYRKLKKEAYKFFIESLRDSDEDLPEVTERRLQAQEVFQNVAMSVHEIIPQADIKTDWGSDEEKIKKPKRKTLKTEGFKRRERRARKRATSAKTKVDADEPKEEEEEKKETIKGKKVIIFVGDGVLPEEFESYQAAGDENGATLTTVKYASTYKGTPKGTIKSMLGNYDVVLIMTGSMKHSYQKKIKKCIPKSVHWEFQDLGSSGLKTYLENPIPGDRLLT